LEQPEEGIKINSLALKLADVFGNQHTTNEIRLALLQELRKCAKVLAKVMLNKNEFANRIVTTLRANNFITRILALRVLQTVPSFLSECLDIQHQILELVKSSDSTEERQAACSCILEVSKSNHHFATQIMSKILECLKSQEYSDDACGSLIKSLQGVPLDAEALEEFCRTVKEIQLEISKRQQKEHLYKGLLETLKVKFKQ